MKTFIIINGSIVQLIERPSIELACQTAQNVCDHSKEIIVREITKVTDYTYIFINQD